jgi:hypothetical protein
VAGAPAAPARKPPVDPSSGSGGIQTSFPLVGWLSLSLLAKRSRCSLLRTARPGRPTPVVPHFLLSSQLRQSLSRDSASRNAAASVVLRGRSPRRRCGVTFSASAGADTSTVVRPPVLVAGCKTRLLSSRPPVRTYAEGPHTFSSRFSSVWIVLRLGPLCHCI